MPVVLNKHHHPEPVWDSVYVGRPSKWGNPYGIGPDGTREEVVAKYAEYIKTQPELLAALSELKGKDLMCWCSPAACHADVLLALANGDK